MVIIGSSLSGLVITKREPEVGAYSITLINLNPEINLQQTHIGSNTIYS